MGLAPLNNQCVAIEIGLTARDLASTEVISAREDEQACDVREWMSANEFDVVPVDGRFDRIVELKSLAACKPAEPAALYARFPPENSVQPSTLGFVETLKTLKARPWFLVADDDRLCGIVTRADLARPAASIFVFALIVQLERMLRRLLGSYSNLQIPDEPPLRPDEAMELGIDAIASTARHFYDLAPVLKEVGKIERLREDLGFASRKQFKVIQNAVVKLRTNVAHARRFYFEEHEEAEVEKGIEQLLEVNQFVERVIDLVNNREQIWDAIAESRIVYVDGSQTKVLAGPQAVELYPFDVDVYVITAANPFEQVLSAEENRRRNSSLETILHSNAATVINGAGESLDGRWSEASFLITGLSEETILMLANRFGQRGVFRVTPNEVIVLRQDGQVMRKTPRCPRI